MPKRRPERRRTGSESHYRQVRFWMSPRKTARGPMHRPGPGADRVVAVATAVPGEGLQADSTDSLRLRSPTGRDRFTWTVDEPWGPPVSPQEYSLPPEYRLIFRPEWDTNWSGFCKRFGSREAQMTMSNALSSLRSERHGAKTSLFSLRSRRHLGANRARSKNCVRRASSQRPIGSCVRALSRGDREQPRCEHLASTERHDRVRQRPPDRQRIPRPVRREPVDGVRA